MLTLRIACSNISNMREQFKPIKSENGYTLGRMYVWGYPSDFYIFNHGKIVAGFVELEPALEFFAIETE